MKLLPVFAVALIALLSLPFTATTRRKHAMLMTIGAALAGLFLPFVIDAAIFALALLIFPFAFNGESGIASLYLLFFIAPLHLFLLGYPPIFIGFRYGWKHGLFCAALILVSLTSAYLAWTGWQR